MTRKMHLPTTNQPVIKLAHPFMSRPELILNMQVQFPSPTGEVLTGTVVGVDTRPVAGGQDGEFLVIQLPPKKDPYAPGEVLRVAISSCIKA